MLTHIQIRDFAIVDELSLDLSTGMTALTGETGAGKSILVDALGLVLGDRADSTTVRHGAERAEISAQFDINRETEARAWLEAQDLAAEECLIRRVIGRDGKSRAWINGSAVTLQSLKTLGEMLVDIHGQHAHQSLLRREVQRRILDDYADHPELLAAMARDHGIWQKAARRLAELSEDGEARAARRDLLRFQTDELKALDLAEGELERIEEEHGRLAHAGRLLEMAETAYQSLYEADGSAESVVGRFSTDIEHLQTLDSRLAEPRELLAAAQIQIREAADWLRRYADGLEMDPARLNFLESRLAAIQDLARKHRVDPTALPHLLETLEAELGGLEEGGENLEALTRAVEQALQTCLRQAAELSDARRRAAERLSEAITRAMQGLGMEGGRFACNVEDDGRGQPSTHGMDRVEFLVSANPGQPLQPLAKVASGGELSRISLAIQMIAAHALPIATLIFDEVDTGIGGGVAEVVGRQLRSLGEHRQVLCVTHLPQVAAQAHQHLQVKKHKGKDHTSTRIRSLADEHRVRELARMLGGIEITEQSLAHAREMITRAASG
ncbi:DNA repair protein RecN [Ectothiorhodospira shaposhnikovii]|uniref:DNA repair protein RecN n=1 Tax=Ectothiorhodospira shaposhnikovii TaxID=1054 RepID=UPI00190324F6|nr:DNA repair protein RecN [Ectothiorhodospira shaposhnikovii]